MGRPRKTPDEHRTDGTYRADRHGERDPVPEREMVKPKIPRSLTSFEAKRMWEFLMRPNVCERGWFAEFDKPLLITFCQTWALYQKANMECEELGFTVEGKEGEKLAPWARMRNQLSDQVVAQTKALGITPIASKSIGISKNQKALNQGKPALMRPRILLPPPDEDTA